MCNTARILCHRGSDYIINWCKHFLFFLRSEAPEKTAFSCFESSKVIIVSGPSFGWSSFAWAGRPSEGWSENVNLAKTIVSLRKTTNLKSLISYQLLGTLFRFFRGRTAFTPGNELGGIAKRIPLRGMQCVLWTRRRMVIAKKRSLWTFRKQTFLSTKCLGMDFQLRCWFLLPLIFAPEVLRTLSEGLSGTWKDPRLEMLFVERNGAKPHYLKTVGVEDVFGTLWCEPGFLLWVSIDSSKLKEGVLPRIPPEPSHLGIPKVATNRKSFGDVVEPPSAALFGLCHMFSGLKISSNSPKMKFNPPFVLAKPTPLFRPCIYIPPKGGSEGKNWEFKFLARKSNYFLIACCLVNSAALSNR